MRRQDDFGFETTLSGRIHLNLIRRMRTQGYAVNLFFLWVPSVELALLRVKGRVAEGGHDVPETVVRRRFGRSIRNFFIHYRQLADSWILFDNAGQSPSIIALEKYGETRIISEELYNSLFARYGRT